MGKTRFPGEFWVVFLLSTALLASVPTWGKVIYVDTDATGANNGSSWADVYNYLQDAIADGNYSPRPVEIRVAKATYRPDENTVHPGGAVIPTTRG
jgi:hypothetical protein